jgi:DNA-binding response OmpR family regulator
MWSSLGESLEMAEPMLKHILVVDDDALLRRGLAFHLDEAGYQVTTLASAEEALIFVQNTPIDLILMDIVLPGMDGLEAVRHLRGYQSIPVIFLTARSRKLDELLGFELGGDDYITKPFDLDLLLARIKALLRRSATTQAQSSGENNPLQVGDITIDARAHTVNVADRPIELRPREFNLLVALAKEPGCVISVDGLISRVWGEEFMGEPQVVYVHIRWLREKIEEDFHNPTRIITIRGVGYKLEPTMKLAVPQPGLPG